MPPFRICILGDFSGRESRGLCETKTLARRPLTAVDRDNFDALPGRLGLEVRIDAAHGAPLRLAMGELDHFRPEWLVENVELFGELRALRRRLQDPSRFAAAAAEMAGWATADTGAAEKTQPNQAKDPSDRAPSDAEPEDLLAASIRATEEQGVVPASSDPAALADRLIARVIAPHVEKAPDPRQADLVAAVDMAMAGLLRTILHAPAFRAAEAAWRGLDLLVRRLDIGTDLKLSLVDATKAELATDLAGAEDPRDSGLYRLLAEPTVDAPGGVPWSLWLADMEFGPLGEDVATLGRLGQVAGRAGAPVIAGGAPGLVGAADFAGEPDPDDWREPWEVSALQAWEALRQTPEAAYLALAMPRWLARLPYGRDSDPVEGFAFEELDLPPRHGQLLWANPAWLAGLAVGAAFARDGWRMRPEAATDIDSLPFYVYKLDGESRAVPCAELPLTERSGARLADRGLTPVWWVTDRDRIRVGPLRSLCEPSPRLAGRWAG